jgi:hypothetical protein
MSEQTDRYDWGEDPTAQDVIDAMRILTLAQKEPAEIARIVECLLEFAPETEGSRGIDLLMRLISEATLKASVV